MKLKNQHTLFNTLLLSGMVMVVNPPSASEMPGPIASVPVTLREPKTAHHAEAPDTRPSLLDGTALLACW